ncbi:hypothetical protein RJ639_023747 [Escallonia herrerae]|uniref:Exostosin GT47 domain-containing protein n=1 Tax=Escallonia herrerae TaxID=1293975 RepID=A0AA89AE91_9ASTE|nr:hypothetical protein RJ639_023747 [Escallonia herrerae]
MRDAASLDLVNSLEKRPEWSIMGGKDHFLVAGRITWDFRRASDEETDWGNKLLFLPAAKNIYMANTNGPGNFVLCMVVSSSSGKKPTGSFLCYYPSRTSTYVMNRGKGHY